MAYLYFFLGLNIFFGGPSICMPLLLFITLICVLSLLMIYQQYTGTHPCTVIGKWKKEEIYWHKNRVIWSIKQGMEENQNETGGPKVTNVDYNIVSPFYISSLINLCFVIILSSIWNIIWSFGGIVWLGGIVMGNKWESPSFYSTFLL